MKERTYSRARWVVNKVAFSISAFFTTSLLVGLSNNWLGKIVFVVFAFTLELGKWMLGPKYKRDKRKFLLFMYILVVAVCALSDMAYALQEMEVVSKGIESVSDMSKERKEKYEKLKKDIIALETSRANEEALLYAYKGDAPTASEREWQMQYYGTEKRKTIESLNLRINAKTQEADVLFKEITKVAEDGEGVEVVDPDLAFRLLGFGKIPANVVKALMVGLLCLFLELFIYQTLDPLEDKAVPLPVVEEALPPQVIEPEVVPVVEVPVPVPISVEVVGLNVYMERLWELQQVKADTGDGAMADQLGCSVDRIKKLRLKLMMLNWKEGPAIKQKPGGSWILQYSPDKVRQIIVKLQEAV